MGIHTKPQVEAPGTCIIEPLALLSSVNDNEYNKTGGFDSSK